MKKPTINSEQISLYIDVFTPETFPMARLADYLKPFSAMLGCEESIHFIKVGPGSSDCLARVDAPAYPKVKERLGLVATGDAPKLAMEAHGRIDELLATDNAIGYVKINGHNVIEFPGRRRAPQEVLGPVRRSTSIDGQIFSIGGKDETINVHLRDGSQEVKCVVSISLARDLGPHLRGCKVRLSGSGFWWRIDGKWTMKNFTADSFLVLNQSSLQGTITSIRKALVGVEPNEFMATMLELRNG
jgi:hypothetical protein